VVGSDGANLQHGDDADGGLAVAFAGSENEEECRVVGPFGQS
jgi:hypothetical protein